MANDVKKLRRDLRRSRISSKPKATGRRVANRITPIGQGLRALGTAVGGYFGAPGIGRQAGATVSRIFGQGDYTIAPGNASTMPPSFSGLDEGYVITHREYLKDIMSSVDYSSDVYYLNPGLTQTFPWLSQIAENFEEYEFKGLVFYLKTNSATAVSSTNTALGVWGAVTQYDASDPDFLSKRECENYMGCSSAVPCSSVLHAVECKSKVNVLDKRYVRTGALDVSEDVKFYDKGKLTIFTQGSQAASNIGELWVSYKVVFRKPKLPVGGSTAKSDRYAYANTITDASPLGTLSRISSGSIGTTIQGSTNKLIFPSWIPDANYLITATWAGLSSTLLNIPTMSYTGSVSVVPVYNSGSGSPGPTISNNNSTSSTFMLNFVVKKQGSAQGTVTFSNNGTLPNSPQLTLIVTEYDPNSLQNSSKIFNQKLTIDELKILRNMMASFSVKNICKTDSSLARVNVSTPIEDYSITEEENELDYITEPQLSRGMVIAPNRRR